MPSCIPTLLFGDALYDVREATKPRSKAFGGVRLSVRDKLSMCSGTRVVRSHPQVVLRKGRRERVVLSPVTVVVGFETVQQALRAVNVLESDTDAVEVVIALRRLIVCWRRNGDGVAVVVSNGGRSADVMGACVVSQP